MGFNSGFKGLIFLSRISNVLILRTQCGAAENWTAEHTAVEACDTVLWSL